MTMTQEQKAKAYDEAIEKLRGLLEGVHEEKCDIMEEDIIKIFPELKESEDERTWIINYLSNRKLNSSIIAEKENLKKAIAWLEKQGEQKLIDKIQLGKMYKCIASPRYSTFVKGLRYVPQDKFLCSLMNFCSDCFEPIEDGEQKPTDKVEPKFHEGEWVVTDKNDVVQIKAIENGKYVLENTMRFSVDYVDKCWRKWTIQDAKDGDVLADDYGIYIFDRFDEEDEKCFLCMGAYQYSQKVYENEHMLCSVEVHPATKEQRDTLMKAMADEGYTFDFKKKELKKIEQLAYKIKPKFKIGDVIRRKDGDGLEWTVENVHKDGNYTIVNSDRDNFVYLDDNWEIVEQKPAWSEEDDDMYIKVETAIDSYYAPFSRDAEEMSEWFKNLKSRVQPQPKQEWSEEVQEEPVSEEFINTLGTMLNDGLPDRYLVSEERIKKSAELLFSIACKQLKNEKQEWSEEDESMLQNILECLKNGWRKLPTDILKYESWLKSLRPQNTWKPSDEQMKALNTCIIQGEISYVGQGTELQSLYNDLKKLTE